MASAEVTGEAGAGLVKVVMTGRHDVRKFDIDPSLLAEDKEMLEDLLRPQSMMRCVKSKRTTRKRWAN